MPMQNLPNHSQDKYSTQQNSWGNKHFGMCDHQYKFYEPYISIQSPYFPQNATVKGRGLGGDSRNAMKKNGNYDGGGTAAAVGRPVVDYGRFRACLMEETCLGRIPHWKLPRPPLLIGTLAQAIRSRPNRTPRHQAPPSSTRNHRIFSIDARGTALLPSRTRSPWIPRPLPDPGAEIDLAPPPVEPIRNLNQRRERAYSSRAWTMTTGSRGASRTPRCRRR